MLRAIKSNMHEKYVQIICSFRRNGTLVCVIELVIGRSIQLPHPIKKTIFLMIVYLGPTEVAGLWFTHTLTLIYPA